MGDMFGRARIGNTCKDCTDRHLACHDTCEKYQDALAEWNEYKETIKQRKKINEYDEYKIQVIAQMKRRRGWHDGKG